MGPALASNTPHGRPLERKLFYLDLPTDVQGLDSRPRVSVLRGKPCRNPYDTEDIPTCLPAVRCKPPPFHATPEDVSAPTDHCEVDHISDHQRVRGIGGFVEVGWFTGHIGSDLIHHPEQRSPVWKVYVDASCCTGLLIPSNSARATASTTYPVRWMLAVSFFVWTENGNFHQGMSLFHTSCAYATRFQRFSTSH